MDITIEYLQQVAINHGWNLNPNEKIVQTVLNGLNKNIEKYGFPYCPCRIQKIFDFICPCIYANNEINGNGSCKCHLFVKESEKK